MKKGFTLIELLAVIVILAIIALIATPIILGIINDAKVEATKRSVEMYANAMTNAITIYQLKEGNEVEAGKYTTTDGKTLTKGETTLTVEYDGEVVCDIIEIYKDGSIYLADCTVNGIETTKTYGTQQSTQVSKTQYYSWSSGNIGEDLPSDAKENLSEINTEGYSFYLKLDVDSDNKVTAAYACFVINETEYCLKGNDIETYENNQRVMTDAFGESECSLEEDYYYCSADALYAEADSYGNVLAQGNYAKCYVSEDSDFGCSLEVG